MNSFFHCLESRIDKNNALYGKFSFNSLPSGQGNTLATSLRRSLFADLSGLAITQFCITSKPGLGYEFATLPGLTESILDFSLNLKKVVLTGRIIDYGLPSHEKFDPTIVQPNTEGTKMSPKEIGTTWKQEQPFDLRFAEAKSTCPKGLRSKSPFGTSKHQSKGSYQSKQSFLGHTSFLNVSRVLGVKGALAAKVTGVKKRKIPRSLPTAPVGFLKVKGPAVIRACDLILPPGIRCVHPNQYLGTLAADAILSIKFLIAAGKGFIAQDEIFFNSLSRAKLVSKLPDAYGAFQSSKFTEEKNHKFLKQTQASLTGLKGLNKPLDTKRSLSSKTKNQNLSFSQKVPKNLCTSDPNQLTLLVSKTLTHFFTKNLLPTSVYDLNLLVRTHMRQKGITVKSQNMLFCNEHVLKDTSFTTTETEPRYSHNTKQTQGFWFEKEKFLTVAYAAQNNKSICYLFAATLHKKTTKRKRNNFATFRTQLTNLASAGSVSLNKHQQQSYKKLNPLFLEGFVNTVRSSKKLSKKQLIWGAEQNLYPVIPLDVSFTPISKVNFQINVNRENEKNEETIIFEIWTNGSITPKRALQETCLILAQNFYNFFCQANDNFHMQSWWKRESFSLKTTSAPKLPNFKRRVPLSLSAAPSMFYMQPQEFSGRVQYGAQAMTKSSGLVQRSPFGFTKEQDLKNFDKYAVNNKAILLKTMHDTVKFVETKDITIKQKIEYLHTFWRLNINDLNFSLKTQLLLKKLNINTVYDLHLFILKKSCNLVLNSDHQNEITKIYLNFGLNSPF